MQSDRNIARRMGRWSAAHPWRSIAAWLAFVVIALFAGSAAGTVQITDSQSAAGESKKAIQIADDAGYPTDAGEQVLIQARSGKLDAASVSTVSGELKTKLAAVPHVRDIEAPLHGKDGRTALVNFTIDGDDEDTAMTERVVPALAAVASVQKAHPELRVEEFGDMSASKAIDEKLSGDFERAEVLSLPITLLILIVTFGALVAAGVPLLLGLTAVASAIGLSGAASHLIPSSDGLSSVILLVGLAVGVDYSLFYIRREREERAAGRDKAEALDVAAATSGRAVLVSGFTVMIAMAGMFLAGSLEFASFALGTILVVGVAMLGSLTVLPAVLAKLGDRVEKGRVPFLSRGRDRGVRESRVWGAVVRNVMRRPKLSLGVSVGLLVALTIPAFGMQIKQSGVEDLPRSIPEMQTYDRIQAAFPGKTLPASVVVKAEDVRTADMKNAIADLRERAVATGVMHEPIDVSVNPRGDVATIDVPLSGSGTDETSEAALAKLRTDIVPATVGKVSEQAWVSGITAENQDWAESMSSHAPLVFLFVLSLAFLLLLVTFRSIVVPLKAIALNLLSVGAAYGMLVLVFQKGWGEGLLGFESNGGIASWLPMFLFVILFGLSMDYHVFILSRIREAVGRGASTEDAVEQGIISSAGTVTSAAVVMVAVFSIFATLSMIDMKQLGVGLAFAILLDATLIRGVVLPAAMKLLGEKNWWLPRRLQWLPEVAHEPAPQGARA